MLGTCIQGLIKRTDTQVPAQAPLSSAFSPASFFTLRTHVVLGLLAPTVWPSGSHTNTPKELLFLSELENLVADMNASEFEYVLNPLLVRLNRIFFFHNIFVRVKKRLIASCGFVNDNFRTVQRGLQFFRNAKISALCQSSVAVYSRVCEDLLPALYRRGQLSWNPTVNKMTAAVLTILQVTKYLHCCSFRA
jgi:hypothetical protein